MRVMLATSEELATGQSRRDRLSRELAGKERRARSSCDPSSTTSACLAILRAREEVRRPSESRRRGRRVIHRRLRLGSYQLGPVRDNPAMPLSPPFLVSDGRRALDVDTGWSSAGHGREPESLL